MTRLALVTCLLAGPVLADIAPPRPPPAECSANSQCVITTFEGCCGACCPHRPYAMSAARLQAAQEQCAVVKCERSPCEGRACIQLAQPPPSAFRAVCEAGRCVARPVGEECRNDSECRVAQVPPPAGAACHTSPCGCCPTNVAVPVGWAPPPPPPTPTPPPTKTPPPQGKGGQPPFGLSTGTTGARPQPEPVNCSPCPPPPPESSACVAGKCTLVPPRPQPRPLPPG